MPPALKMLWRVIEPFVRFAWYVAREFYQNNGILMAGALGYNALISLVPLIALFFVVASNFADTDMLLQVIHAQLTLVLPGEADQFTEAFESVLGDTAVIGGVGFLVLIFFSSIGFRMLQSAMGVIFRHHKMTRDRHPIVSLLIPLVYVSGISIALVVLTAMMSIVDATEWTSIQIGMWDIPIKQWNTWWLYIIGFIVLILILSSFYRYLPVIKVRWQLALVGGFVAGSLWEIVRQILVYYFANLSLVNVVYGSLGTIVIVLVGMEVAGAILLLGAQVISNLEQNQIAGRRWWEDPLPGNVLKPNQDSGLFRLQDLAREDFD